MPTMVLDDLQHDAVEEPDELGRGIAVAGHAGRVEGLAGGEVGILLHDEGEEFPAVDAGAGGCQFRPAERARGRS